MPANLLPKWARHHQWPARRLGLGLGLCQEWACLLWTPDDVGCETAPGPVRRLGPGPPSECSVWTCLLGGASGACGWLYAAIRLWPWDAGGVGCRHDVPPGPVTRLGQRRWRDRRSIERTASMMRQPLAC